MKFFLSTRTLRDFHVSKYLSHFHELALAISICISYTTILLEADFFHSSSLCRAIYELQLQKEMQGRRADPNPKPTL